ncbi:MAG: hypothetical protein KF716_20160 [Anaerolineae bacterium]|nr:hypothetical protein [Anaerolineae bacterium]
MEYDISKQTIFVAVNNHSTATGIPPHINTAISGQYYGYFQNEHGEQFIFVYERESKKGSLWCGDYDWERPVAVIDGDAPELILGKAERLWLASCWMAATEFETS